jgi:hypothetical protein
VRALEGPGLTPLTKWAEAGPLSVRLSLTGRPPRRGQVRRRRRVMTVSVRLGVHKGSRCVRSDQARALAPTKCRDRAPRSE